MASPRSGFAVDPIPARAGIGLRSDHYQEVVETKPNIGFVEVHSENYFGRGGTPHRYLEKIRAEYPLSLHGVGMSLGSADALDADHLKRLKELVDYYQPALVSEHLSWGSVDGRYLNDLLPMPYTKQSVQHMADKVKQVQDYLGRQMLVENVSCYLEYHHSTMPEWEFVTEVSQQADCGILLDVNNIYVNSKNHGFDPHNFLSAIPLPPVQEIHLAGYTVNRFDDGEILIDTHNHRISDPVWDLYRAAVRRFGVKPTLIEWDTDLPALSVLIDEAAHAQQIVEEEIHAQVA